MLRVNVHHRHVALDGSFDRDHVDGEFPERTQGRLMAHFGLR
jgi:hypothetical protein